MVQSINMQANQYEVYGNGFGALTYNGQPLARVSAFKDSGQQPLGNPIIPYTIGDKLPPTIISPQALQPGKLEIHADARNEGSWGSILNGRFANAKNLADLLSRIQSERGSVQLEWVVCDREGNAIKGIVYKNVTMIDASSGLHTCVINAMYTDTLEKPLD